jgi:NodT family efflux transporter outer membrane factor (OMF) lipoprotein
MRCFMLACLPLVLAACTVGPDYQRPAVPGAAAGWVTPVPQGAVDLAPWSKLGDPVLADLIAQALAASPAIAEAEGRLREARAALGVAGANGAPQATLNGSAQQNRTSLNGAFPVGKLPGYDRNFSLFQAGFDASWEVDLWGGQRRAVQSAQAQIVAAQARATDVRLQTVAEVVRAYAQLRGGQAMLAAARADAAAQAETAHLIRQRLAAGESAQSDESRAREAARSAHAPVAGLEADVRTAAFALALLTGRAPEALAGLIDTPAALPALPANLAVGMRADVLRRRPDVRAAEADLAAATANIGVETANLYPRLSLAGGIDPQSRALGNLATGESLGFVVGPRLSWTLFDGGRVRAQIRAADARADQAAARYTRAVLGALADSETAINRYGAWVATAAEREAALAASARSLELARQRTLAGEDDRLALLQAQSGFANAQRAAAQAHEAAFEAYAALVKALGGGWVAQAE